MSLSGVCQFLYLFTFRFNSSKSNRPRRVLKIVILIASRRIVQSHDCCKGKTRPKPDLLMCGAYISFRSLYFMFSRDGFFFKLNTTFVCLQFTRHLSCAPNKNGAWQRDYSVQKTHMRVSHIQLACKHCNFQSLMFLSTFLVGGIFKTSIRNWCSWITFWLSDFQSKRRKEFFTLPFWMSLCFVGYKCSQIWLQQRRHAIETERVIYLRLRLNSRARSGMINKCSAVKNLHMSSA